ncbi:MAG: hypothetical protein WDO71_13495 [Bacteroidota bacterium]
MKHKLNSEFYEICEQIVSENKNSSEWAAIESDDMFQSSMYEGGFDATGMEFVFSVFLEDKEYWFQLNLDNVYKIHNNQIAEVDITEAD